jgi:Flp pilus assembly pilin Flp
MMHGKITPRTKNGQSFIEYTLLIIIVAAALTAMTTYITRSMNARMQVESGN